MHAPTVTASLNPRQVIFFSAILFTCLLLGPADLSAQVIPCVDYGAQPQPVATLSLAPYEALDLATNGTAAYVLRSDGRIVVVDWSDPLNPVAATIVDPPGSVRDLATGNQALYLVDGSGGLQVYDLVNPLAPVQGVLVTPAGEATALCVDDSGQGAFLVFTAGGLQGVDLSAPLAPQLRGQLALYCGNRSVAVQGDRAYVVGSGLEETDIGAFHVVDVGDLTAPVLLGSDITPGDGFGWGSRYEDVSAGPAGVFIVHYDYWYDWDASYTYADRFLREFDVSNPADPHRGPACLRATEHMRGTVVGNFVVAVASEEGPQDPWCPDCIWDRNRLMVTGPGGSWQSPWSSLALAMEPAEVVAAGEHLLVAGGSAGLLVVEVEFLSPELDPGTVPQDGVRGEAAGVSDDGSLVAVAWHHEGGCYPGDIGGAGIKLYDVTGGPPDDTIGSWGQQYAGQLPPDITFVGDTHIYAGRSIFSYGALPAVELVGLVAEDVGSSVMAGGWLVGLSGADAVRTWDVSDPETPVATGNVSLSDVRDLAARGDHVYVAHAAGVSVFRVGVGGGLTEVGELVLFGPRLVAVSENLLAMTLDTGELLFFGLDDPAQPQLLGELELETTATDLVLDDHAYLALGDLGWLVVDPGEGADPQVTGRIDGIDATQVHLASDMLVLVDDCPTDVWFTGLACPAPSAVPPHQGMAIGAVSIDRIWPNPANPRLVVSFSLAHQGHVLVDVFDLAGHRLVRLAERPYDAGSHRLEWDGRDTAGRAAATGVYLVRVQLDDESTARKLTLAR